MENAAVEAGLHSSQITLMIIGAMMMLFGGLVLRYNFNRKSKRVSQKMPAGWWFILGLTFTGAYTIFYGYTLEVKQPVEIEEIVIEQSIDSLADEGGEVEVKGRTNFLSEVSKSAK